MHRNPYRASGCSFLVSRYRDFGLFVLLGAIWGAAYPAIKVGVASVPPVLYAAVRYDIASLVMLGYVGYASDYWRPRTRGDWFNVGVGGVFIIGAYNAFVFVGETIVPSAIAAILIGLVPLFTTAFTRALLPTEGLDVAGGVGLLLGFLGILVVSRPDPTQLLTSDVVGQGFILIAAASMAFGSVLSQRVESALPVLTMEAWSMALGAVTLHLAAFARPSVPVWEVQWTTQSIVMLGYLAIFSSAIAYFLYFDLLERLGPVEMNFIAYAAAAFGALSGWLFLDERITVFTLTGFGLIVGGFVLLKRDEIRREIVRSRTSRDAK